MSIQKKSLISTLKAAKKANVASAPEADAKGSKVSSLKVPLSKAAVPSFKAAHLKHLSGKKVGQAKVSFLKNNSYKVAIE
jgi:hypothetical protein